MFALGGGAGGERALFAEECSGGLFLDSAALWVVVALDKRAA